MMRVRVIDPQGNIVDDYEVEPSEDGRITLNGWDYPPGSYVRIIEESASTATEGPGDGDQG